MMFIAVYMDWVRASVGILIAVLLLVISGILTPAQSIAGFANPSISIIVMLILITSGLKDNYDIESQFTRIYGKITSYKRFMLYMMSKVALLSSFINNTPIVVLFTPFVVKWGKQRMISPSKLLIPLSYATISGGMLTIIGTSTTLVLRGFMQEFNLPAINPFHLFFLGFAATMVIILFITMIGYRLLPDNLDLIEKFEQNRREYLAENRLSANSPLIGKSVINAGLRNLQGLYLVEIVRREELIYPVSPDEIIQDKDVLIFAGNTENIVEVITTFSGIEIPVKPLTGNQENLQVVEAVIGANSSLTGKTVKEADFRNRYDAAVVAIHRNGERLSGKIGNIKLKGGDVLLVYAGDDFNNRVDVYKDLYIISRVNKETKQLNQKRYLVPLLAVIALGLLFIGGIPLFTAILVIFVAMVLLKMISLKTIKRELDFEMVAVLALSIALGQAVIKTGTGQLIGDQLISLFSSFGNTGILFGLMIFTTFLTSLVSNVAAVSIAFPLAYSISSTLGLDGGPYYLAVAFAASAAFLTPIGYQTNLIVFGPGGYKFRDFITIGIPVTLLYLIVIFLGLRMLYPI